MLEKSENSTIVWKGTLSPLFYFIPPYNPSILRTPSHPFFQYLKQLWYKFINYNYNCLYRLVYINYTSLR